MKLTIKIIIAIAFLAALLFVVVWRVEKSYRGKLVVEREPIIYKDFVRLENPLPHDRDYITSPLVVRGSARGNWFFEASFPIHLLDGNGKEIAVAVAQAQGEWMTTEYVPFEAILIFESPATEDGTLILEKDNPSELPEHDDDFRIPIRFR